MRVPMEDQVGMVFPDASNIDSVADLQAIGHSFVEEIDAAQNVGKIEYRHRLAVAVERRCHGIAGLSGHPRNSSPGDEIVLQARGLKDHNRDGGRDPPRGPGQTLQRRSKKQRKSHRRQIEDS